MAILGLFKIKVFQSKDYDVMISVDDVTNKNLLRYPSYFVAWHFYQRRFLSEEHFYQRSIELNLNTK